MLKSKKLLKVISVLLCTALLSSVAIFGASAQTVQKDYTITNPYAQVNWDTWTAYKTQLHCHTTASDGFLTIHESVQSHFDRDYDIVAITDHGTINAGWTKKPQTMPLLRLIKYERTKLAEIIPLTQEEYMGYYNGTAESETRTHTNGMLDVPKGIELNAATPKCDCHLTGYFSDYGQGLMGVYGDYETPSEGVKEAGGISMLAHVGEYVYPEKDSENYVGQKVDDYFANKFARLFIDNAGSSLGMGINSATDDHTRCDRILYDQVLAKTIPNGVVPWGFTFSDSHNSTSLNDAYTYMYMEQFNTASFRKSMEDGTFFSVSHFSNGVELNGMRELPEGFKADPESNETPMVTKVSVDDENDKITINGINFNQITWVSNGNVILRENVENGTATLDLNDEALLNQPSLFVRFYITGDQGICYSQPFVLNVKGETMQSVDVPKTNDTSTKLRTLVTVLDELIFKHSLFVRIFKLLAAGYWK